jgi:hypothetical protein
MEQDPNYWKKKTYEQIVKEYYHNLNVQYEMISENIARLHQWKKQEREIKRMIVMLKKKKCDTLALTREIKKLEGETENGTRPKLLEEKNL